MDSRIRFESKEESNARRLRDFLALSPSERVEWFFRSFNDRLNVPLRNENADQNFIIRKHDDALR